MKHPFRTIGLFGLLLLFTLLLAQGSHVGAAPIAVAYDMVGSTGQNLISFTDDPAIPFTSPADGFNKFQRGVSPTIPFAVADDSADCSQCQCR